MKTASSTSAEKARLRENARRGFRRASNRTSDRTPIDTHVEPLLPAVAENGRVNPLELGLEVEPVGRHRRRALELRQQDRDQERQDHAGGLQRRVEARPGTRSRRGRAGEPLRPRKHIRPSVPQPKVWAKKTISEIGTKRIGAKPEPPEPAQPQPEAEGEEGERHRQREIDEAEVGTGGNRPRGSANSTVGGTR